MEIQFIRKLMTSHMVVLAHANVLNEWEEKMISHATIKGILFADYICEDGQCNLWYDITGKNSLDVLLEEKTLDYELLCHIFVELYEAVEGLEDLLLRGENLLLTPETIFWDYRQQEVYFCYCPGEMDAVEERFIQLLEYLLKKLEHTDEKAVEMAYEIYNQATKIGWSLRDLKRLVCFSYDIENVREDDAAGQEVLVESEVTEHRAENEEEASERIESCSLWNRIRRYEQGTQLVDKIKCTVMEYVKPLFNGKIRDCNTEQERFVFEPEEEKEAVSQPTVLLTEQVRPPEGILRYEGTSGCQDIVIDKSEIIIGNHKECNGRIASATVSRRHAKVTRKEDIYFLEDLNSTNGTYVGGQLLNYKTKVSLQKNEIVIFADEKFRFI